MFVWEHRSSVPMDDISLLQETEVATQSVKYKLLYIWYAKPQPLTKAHRAFLAGPP